MLDNIVSVITSYVSQYGYWGIFVLMFLENLGLPIPTEIGFLVGQTMVMTGKSQYSEIFGVILLGKTSGSLISYFLGKHFAGRIKFYDSKKLQDSQKIFKSWMAKYGNFAVFISRLIGYIRPWSSYLAGLGEIKTIPFIFYNVIGSSVIILITMLVLGSAVEIWLNNPILRPLAVPLFLLFFFGFWIGLYFYKKRKQTKK